MGEYQDKVEKHFWMMLCSSLNEIGNKEAFKEKLEPVFKIKSKEAIKLVEDPLWTKLYSVTREIRNPVELKKKLEPIVKIDTGRVRDNIWHLLILAVSDSCDKKTFREIFEPLFRIDTRGAVKLVEDHLWAILYSMTRKTQDPKELNKQFKPLVQIDVKRAAEAIKEVNPEKYEFLQLYK